jgi:hypothetical protein
MILAPTLSLNAGSGAAIARPTFSRDFAGEKTLNNGTGPAITFTRASNATFFDASGTLQTASNDTPRFDHSGGSSLGLLIEEARTNSIRNSQAGGSTNGVIGSGGVMPTNWFVGGGSTTNGISTEVIGTGTETGIPYIDLKISGTPTATANANNFTELQNVAAAASGQTWTASCYAKLVAGSLTNATVSLVLETRDSSNVFVANAPLVTINATSSSLRTQRFVNTHTLTGASVAFIAFHVRVAYTSGNLIDLTLRIAAPQLEQGAFPTSYIPTTTAAATRAADSAVVTPIASFYNQSEGTLFAEAPATYAQSADIVQFAEASSANNRFVLFFAPTGTLASFQYRTSGVIEVTGGVSVSSGAIAKIAAAFAANDARSAVNGTLTTADTSVTLNSANTHMVLGRLQGAASYLNGHIRKIAYWPRRLSNTLLQQLTT